MLKPALRLLTVCLLAPLLLVRGGTYTSEENEVPKTANILVLGKDDASSLADVIILANVNSADKKLTLLQIPRDTYVNFGDDCKKINGASKHIGDEALCKKLGESMGLDVEGYVAFDTDFVRELVDLLGGVELYVPMDMDYDDPYQNLSIHLKKGKQILSGSEAVGFVRYRKGYLRADIGRIDAQKIFVSAFAKKLIEKTEAKDLLPLSKMAIRYIKTNLPISKLVSLGRYMRQTLPENISFATMPGEEVRSEKSGAWFYILSKSGCAKLVEDIGSEGEFDKAHLYSDASRDEFEEIYNREIEAQIYSAADIDGEGIEIKPK